MIYITGDKHGDLSFLDNFIRDNPNTTVNDVMIILGDVGINFFINKDEKKIKKHISKLPITLLCIHGNHEVRPRNINSYKLIDKFNAKAYQERKYPNILFALDGENYSIEEHEFLVLGGAYSTDKYMRLKEGWLWFESEQASPDIKIHVDETINRHDNKFDIVLSHTCPFKFMKEFDIRHSYIDPNHEIDYSTEEWLDKIENQISYYKWYFGHFHEDKVYSEKVVQLYNKILVL